MRETRDDRKDRKQLAKIGKAAETVADKPGPAWGDLCDQAVAVVQRGNQRRAQGA